MPPSSLWSSRTLSGRLTAAPFNMAFIAAQLHAPAATTTSTSPVPVRRAFIGAGLSASVFLFSGRLVSGVLWPEVCVRVVLGGA